MRGTNSPGRHHLGPTEHATPNSPNRCHCVAQNAQSVQRVPMHLHAAWPRSAPEPARHDTPDATTTLLIPVEHHIDPAAHRFPGLTTEPDAISHGTDTHRHHLRVPWNQPTTPLPEAAHGAQPRPRPSTLYRDHSSVYNPGNPLEPFSSSHLLTALFSLTYRVSPSLSRGETTAGELELREYLIADKGGGCCQPRRLSALSLWLTSLLTSPGSHPLFVPGPGHAVAVAIADICQSRREDFIISASHPSLCMHVP
jgi:hypothetical protein